jgi:HAMP domain-containing protein
MRNLYKPVRYNVASIQAQQTLGGDCMESNENGIWVEFRDYLRLLEDYKFLQQWKRDADAETLKFDSGDWFASKTLPERIKHIIDTNAFSNDQWKELNKKVEHLELFKSVVEKFFNSADLKNQPDAQSCYALAENLKQLPDSILDFTQEQVRDNPAWALAVFRHKVKEMQYKRCHDLNEIGGEQEENARLKAEVELWKLRSDNWQKFCQLTRPEMTDELNRLQAEVERLTELNATLSLRYDATKSMLDGCAKEIEEMEAEVERLTDFTTRTIIPNEELQAQVERLVSAGEDLAHAIRSKHGIDFAIEEWVKVANTEGGQS